MAAAAARGDQHTPPSSLARRLRSLLVVYRLLSLPHVRRRPGSALVLLIAVSMGVAAVVASGSLVDSALRSLERTWGAGSEFSDLRVGNGFAGVSEELLEIVRGVEGVGEAAGILTGRANANLGGEHVDLTILAVDLFGDDRVHASALSSTAVDALDEIAFLSRIDAIALPRDFASSHGVELGSSIETSLSSGRRQLYVAGLLEPSPVSALFSGAIALMDLPAAQRILGREGLLDAIDVRLVPGASVGEVSARLAERVAGRATVAAPNAASPELRNLLSSVRLILGITGLIAMVVGGFVIYDAVAISASRRAPEMGVVRSLGASRRLILAWLTGEAVLLAVLGCVVGSALGAALARGAAGMFQQLVGSLYLPLAETSFDVSRRYVVWGGSLALLLTCAVSLGPVRGAARIGSGLAVVSHGGARWRSARRLAGVGAVALMTGILLGYFQRPGLESEVLARLAIAGDVTFLLGVGLLAPVIVLSATPIVERWLRAPALAGLRFAWRGLASDPGRNAAVISAVLVSSAYVVMTVGIVESLRGGVLGWLGATLRSDLLVTGPTRVGLLPSSPPIRGDLAETIGGAPGVEAVEPHRLITQPFRNRWVSVVEKSPDLLGNRDPVVLVGGDLEAARKAMRAGTGVVVSEHFVLKHGLVVGDSITLRSIDGPVEFRIDAVVVDFTSADLGTIFVSPDVFRKHWREDAALAYHVWISSGSDEARVAAALETKLAELCDCSVMTRDEVETGVAGVVDATFYTTYALEVVAAVVMVVSIASFLVIAMAERRREIATLRSVGATRRQLFGMHLLESALIGLIGGVLGCASGALLARRQVEDTIRAGGGMLLDFVLPWQTFVIVAGVAILVCVLGAMAPIAWSLRKTFLDAAGASDA